MNRPYINYAQRITSKIKWQYKHIYCPQLCLEKLVPNLKEEEI